MTPDKVSSTFILLVLSALANSQEFADTITPVAAAQSLELDINCNGKSAVCVGPLMYRNCLRTATGEMLATGGSYACPINSRCVNDGAEICVSLKTTTETPFKNTNSYSTSAAVVTLKTTSNPLNAQEDIDANFPVDSDMSLQNSIKITSENLYNQAINSTDKKMNEAPVFTVAMVDYEITEATTSTENNFKDSVTPSQTTYSTHENSLNGINDDETTVVSIDSTAAPDDAVNETTANTLDEVTSDTTDYTTEIQVNESTGVSVDVTATPAGNTDETTANSMGGATNGLTDSTPEAQVDETTVLPLDSTAASAGTADESTANSLDQVTSDTTVYTTEARVDETTIVSTDSTAAPADALNETTANSLDEVTSDTTEYTTEVQVDESTVMSVDSTAAPAGTADESTANSLDEIRLLHLLMLWMKQQQIPWMK
uniref:Uncharacterized protein n=1 Tax=Glossina palpalis gambiensis TaxID=67801 RepID=A0A1B0AYH9_9MUSC